MINNVSQPIEADLTVVGAGPAGLYATYYSGFRGLRTVVVDALPEAGGQVSAMYPEKLLYDVAGFLAVRGRELVDTLKAQADRYGPTWMLGSCANDLVRTEDGRWLLTMADGRQVLTGAVVVTGGIGSFTPRPLPAGRHHEGRGLVYFVPSLAEMADLDVVVVGGGDSALDWALTLEPLARSVTLVHRRAGFRGHAGTLASVRASSVEVITEAQVTAITGADWVESVTVTGARCVQERKCQAVVAALGFTADLGAFESWGMKVVDRHLAVDTTMATNLPAVFAAGDIADYPGKVRLISVGFGEAATAVNNAAALLDPTASVFPGHSSEI
jgi:thioredoxin reductase